MSLACALSCFDTMFYALFSSANVNWIDHRVGGRCPHALLAVFEGLIDIDLCESDLIEEKDIGI